MSRSQAEATECQPVGVGDGDWSAATAGDGVGKSAKGNRGGVTGPVEGNAGVYIEGADIEAGTAGIVVTGNGPGGCTGGVTGSRSGGGRRGRCSII